ncbi:GGDEF domain-containing protein [Pelagibacterium halotolerans]|uniref:GGDEF domain-containing protein n=1 Tax=Pelagibacterium halotolerans TaxID=531813 RepID=UPI00384C2CFE
MTDPRVRPSVVGQGSAILDLLMKDPEIMAEANRLLSGRTRDIWLKGKIARAYRERSWRQSAKVIRSWMIWVIILDLMMLLLNMALLPRNIAVDMLAPGVLMVPAALGVVLVWSKHRGEAILSGALAAGMMVILLSVCLFGVTAGDALLERYLNIMLFVALTGIIIFNVPFALTQGIAAVALGLYLAFLLQSPGVDVKSALSGFFFFASGVGATVVARRTMTILAQKSFLLELRDRRNMIELAESHRHLEQIAKVDALTGVANRHWMQEKLDALWQQGAPIALLMCDIDDFKALNDHLGHMEGDRCLTRVARVIEECVRSEMDCVARYGGEEFLVLLADATDAEAMTTAERIRQRVAAARMPNPGSRVSSYVTLSIGVAVSNTRSNALTAEKLQTQADTALYFAKRAGRNQVRLWDANTHTMGNSEEETYHVRRLG